MSLPIHETCEIFRAINLLESALRADPPKAIQENGTTAAYLLGALTTATHQAIAILKGQIE